MRNVIAALALLGLGWAAWWLLSSDTSGADSSGDSGGADPLGGSYIPVSLSSGPVGALVDIVNQGTKLLGLDALATALTQTEGGPGNLNYRNNNPGNLKYAGQYGATGSDANGFAVFPSFGAGNDALKRQINLDASRHPDWTLLQWATHWLGGNPDAPQVTGEGDPFGKATTIANALGVSVSTTLSQILNG